MVLASDAHSAWEHRRDGERMYGAVVLFFWRYAWEEKQSATPTAIPTLDSGETGKFSARVAAPYNRVKNDVIGDVMTM